MRVLADRSALAGSIATMDQLVRSRQEGKADIPLADAIRMASGDSCPYYGRVYDRKRISPDDGEDAGYSDSWIVTGTSRRYGL